jgi:5-(carboxyamino)imidazole ribonucleotide synthase
VSSMPTIGILGGGQLGRMLALAGYPLGLQFKFFDPDPQAPSGQMAPHTPASYADTEQLEAFAASVDIVTYEFENVPVEAAHRIAAVRPIYPPASALEAAQDRLVEKSFLKDQGVPTPLFHSIDCAEDCPAAATHCGLPAVLKTRRMGYDGKGQRVVHTLEELSSAALELGPGGLILEQFMPFTAECSILAVRSTAGETVFYPLVENVHKKGILFSSRVPAAPAIQALQPLAEKYAADVLEALQYVGVLAIEFFVVDGSLVANEMAPRVHNSGHWTIEGAETSQFENHLRAILGLPLGAVRLRGEVGMRNIIGPIPQRSAILLTQGAHLHLYGKSARPNRKVGHVTVIEPTSDALNAALAAVDAAIQSAVYD